MKPILTMAAEWASFEQEVLPDATPAMRKQMRRAFYAGARSLLFNIMSGIDPRVGPTEADENRIPNLNAELTRFVEDVRSGRA